MDPAYPEQSVGQPLCLYKGRVLPTLLAYEDNGAGLRQTDEKMVPSEKDTKRAKRKFNPDSRGLAASCPPLLTHQGAYIYRQELS